MCDTLEKAVSVECSANHKYPGNPKQVVIDEKRHDVKRIIGISRTPEKEVFQVELNNGESLRLAYLISYSKWIVETN